MGYPEHRVVPGDDRDDLSMSMMVESTEFNPPPGAAQGNRDVASGTNLRKYPGTCGRWGEELRESLRGRRLYTLFALVNLVNYMDRAVVPGGSEEFNVFIREKLHTDQPDVFLGVLQSAYILGFSVACLMFARLARFNSPFNLMGVGLGVWCGSAVMAGLAHPLGSYAFLVVARLFSGVGEASFITVVPPLITETAPPGERGLWLALFYTAMPVGAGLGYVYGSVMATSAGGWQWAFFVEAIVMAPLALACSVVPHHRATAVPNSSHYGTSSAAASKMTNTNGFDGSGRIGSGSNSRPFDPRGGADPSRDGDNGGELEELGGGVAQGGDEYEVLLGGSDRKSRSDGPAPPESDEEAGDTPDEALTADMDAGMDNASRNRGRSARRRINGDAGRAIPSGGNAALLENTESRRRTPRARQRLRTRQVSGVDEGGLDEAWTEARLVNGGHEEPYVRSKSRERMAPRKPSVLGAVEDEAGGALLTADFLRVIERPVFSLVILGAAANAAVTAGMSTFGTGFVTSLELLPTETAAAATFGSVICIAGIVGTPGGGALIDSADPEGRLSDAKKLKVVLLQGFCLVTASTVLLLMATSQSKLVPFLLLMFVGATLLFSCTPHMNLAIMLASPEELRPLALAINSIAVHALGDVPSPAAVGALKDALAPHCAGSGRDFVGRGLVGLGAGLASAMGDAGEGRGGGSWVHGGDGAWGAISDACRSERKGLHLTLFIMSAWLFWTCIFFAVAASVQGAGLKRGRTPVLWADILGLARGARDSRTSGDGQESACCTRRGSAAYRRGNAASGAHGRRAWWRLGWRSRKARSVSSLEEGLEVEGSSLDQPLI